MSNSLAVATVTATLSQVLQTAVNTDVAGATVRTVRPDNFRDGNPPRGVSLFLYQVSPNGALRNMDLPTRRADGAVIEQPLAALDLHYLLSFFGDEAQMEPQRMLGNVVGALHARPVLTRERIRAAVAAAVAADPNHFLGRSDLAGQVELVRLAPMPLGLEDLSRLWSVFFQVPYSLSVVYQASVVLIEGRERPQAALPVQSRGVSAVPLRLPQIEQVIPQAPELTAGTVTITLEGQNLFAPSTAVRFGDLESAPGPSATDTELPVTLPAGILAGVRTAQVIHFLNIGEPPTPHRIFDSNPAPFLLRPRITASFSSPAEGPTVTVVAERPIGPLQQVMLLLNEQPPAAAPAPRGFSFDSTGRVNPVATIAFRVAGVPAATYWARLRVDGAESAPQTVVIP